MNKDEITENTRLLVSSIEILGQEGWPHGAPRSEVADFALELIRKDKEWAIEAHKIYAQTSSGSVDALVEENRALGRAAQWAWRLFLVSNMTWVLFMVNC